MSAGTKGYVQLRRGLLEHLSQMGTAEVKVYIACLMLADPNTGALSISQTDLCEVVGLGKPAVCRSLRSLSSHQGKRPAYIVYEPSANQWSVSRIRIIKFRRSSSAPVSPPNGDSAPRIAGNDLLPPRITARQQQRNSNATATQQHEAVTCGNDPPNSYESYESYEKRENAREEADEKNPAITGGTALPACMQERITLTKPRYSGTCEGYLWGQVEKQFGVISPVDRNVITEAVKAGCIPGCDGEHAQTCVMHMVYKLWHKSGPTLKQSRLWLRTLTDDRYEVEREEAR